MNKLESSFCVNGEWRRQLALMYRPRWVVLYIVEIRTAERLRQETQLLTVCCSQSICNVNPFHPVDRVALVLERSYRMLIAPHMSVEVCYVSMPRLLHTGRWYWV